MSKDFLEVLNQMRQEQINISRKPVDRLHGYFLALETKTFRKYHKSRGRSKLHREERCP